jgi:hypothetical protein
MALVLAWPVAVGVVEQVVFVTAAALAAVGVYLALKPSDFGHRGDGAGPDGGEHDKSRARFYKDPQKKGAFIQPDRAGDRTHGGGKQWKVFDARGKRQGTINEEGEKIRD